MTLTNYPLTSTHTLCFLLALSVCLSLYDSLIYAAQAGLNLVIFTCTLCLLLQQFPTPK